MKPKLETYKTNLVGKKLKRVLHSDQGEGVEHLNGLGYAYYFSTVLELENGDLYDFSDHWIILWDETEPLQEVTHNNWRIKKNIQYKNQLITDIIILKDDQLYIILQNDVIIYHTTTYGDKLFFDKYSNLFDSDNTIKDSLSEKSFWSKLKTYILD